MGAFYLIKLLFDALRERSLNSKDGKSLAVMMTLGLKYMHSGKLFISVSRAYVSAAIDSEMHPPFCVNVMIDILFVERMPGM